MAIGGLSGGLARIAICIDQNIKAVFENIKAILQNIKAVLPNR